MKTILSVATLCLFGRFALGSVVASDNAANSAYDDGWQYGDNGGFGFNPWSAGVFLGTDGGFFAASSGNNGFGNSSPNIDTSGKAWGMYANTGTISSATRTVASVDPGDITKYSFDIDNGFIDNGTFLTLPKAVFAGAIFDGTSSFGVAFRGGEATYDIYFSPGSSISFESTSIGFQDTGLHVDIERLGGNMWEVTLMSLATSASYSKAFDLGTSVVDGVVFQNNVAGSGSSNDFFANNLSAEAVPEPGTICLLGAGIAGLIARRKK